jgi:hypothetical protein
MQVNAKEIDEPWFRKLVAELDLERVMGESMAEGPAMMQAMTQDEEVSKSKWDESVEEEEPEAAEVPTVAEASTISKQKQKVDGPVSYSAKVVINMQLTHKAHSATSVLLGRRSRCASPCLTSGTARSASRI